MGDSHGLVLKNVHFGYNEQPVLYVDNLALPEKGMVFITGPSGAGKSTLLEGLGLMTNSFIYSFGGNSKFEVKNEEINPRQLWSSNSDSLSRIRREVFGFIFQSTNLMPNFTVGENIRMSADDEMNDDILEEKINDLLKTLSLPIDILDKAPYHISGGQKQRVAFVRAMVSKFSIILADEPTGNLDYSNSINLIGILKNFIEAENKLAIIVTHHIEMAKEFGDYLVKIEPGNHGVAVAKTEHIDR